MALGGFSAGIGGVAAGRRNRPRVAAVGRITPLIGTFWRLRGGRDEPRAVALFRDDAATTVRKSANVSTPWSDENFFEKGS